ncbi:RagB/SusD family nutrient uptake outer membrane protein [Desertivirga brevis]|uniref:RagB/SusD family nutrient uptake outer membrane protein n=1 Tax=Desertivirga brevis TaxID=2810310 RepID=UPI001A975BEE|nr:RagB/SusD family nutrient uptake outer membrane protein [Pedobacter sp. SYSU D00873]
MKQTKIKILTILLALAVSSCNKDLIDIGPISNNTTESFYTSEVEVRQAVVGIYARLGRNGTNTDFATDYYWLASENRSDLLYLGAETSAQNNQLEFRKFLTSPTNSGVSGIYSRLYSLIKDANNLLARTKEGEYTRYRAEAMFLRAFAYSELARSFGPVALVTTPIESDQAVSLPRASLTEVYALIISDLEFAGANLNKFYTGAESGRIGSVAAKALLGQVYMTMGGYPYNDATAYGKAEATFAGIIADVDTRWQPDYSKLFILANENKNDIFSIQFASGGLNVGSSLPGFITSSSSTGTPYPDWVFTSYSNQGQDVRVDSAVVKEMKANNDLRFAPSIDEGYWADKAHTTWVSRAIVTKFLEKDPTNATIKSWNDFPRNFPIIRPADVYLYYAEALIRNGKAGQARTFVNKIRTRAGLPALTADPTMEDIKRERKFEFIGEGRRFFDLVRWGETEALETLTAFARHYHSLTNGQLPTKRDLLLPIPQDEMKTRNNWENNFGY